MHRSDDAGSTPAAGRGPDRPAYGARAVYLELNEGTSGPPAADPGDDVVEGGPNLLDRLHDIYAAAPGTGDDRDASA